MAVFNRQEIIEGLEHPGQMAQARGLQVRLVLVGGAVMGLAYDARPSTRDVDAITLAPREARTFRDLARLVAEERGWPEDWLNDAATGYLVGLSTGPVLLSAPGIEVRMPAVAQLLAMKLSAWRDDVDIADAHRLLEELAAGSDRESAWASVEPFLVPGDELKAQYAFDDLWEALYGDA